MRYHRAVVARQAATVALLSDGRVTLGLGAGENLVEHVVGRGWPAVNVRHEMFAEAMEIIDALFGGEYVNYVEQHFRIDSAKVWHVPAERPGIGVTVSGPQSIDPAVRHGDHVIAVGPDADLVQRYAQAGGTGRRIGQVPICSDPTRDAAIERTHDQFRGFAGG